MFKEMILVGATLFSFPVLATSDAAAPVKNPRHGLFWYETPKKRKKRKLKINIHAL